MGFSDEDGTLGALVAVGALATAGLGHSGSRSSPGPWCYTHTVTITNESGILIERGYMVEGEFVEYPEESLSTTQHRRWLRGSGIPRPLDLASSSEVLELMRLDPGCLEIPEWMRAATSYAKLLVDQGAKSVRMGLSSSRIEQDAPDLPEGFTRRHDFHAIDTARRTIRGVVGRVWPCPVGGDFVRSAVRRLVSRSSDPVHLMLDRYFNQVLMDTLDLSYDEVMALRDQCGWG